MLLYLHNIYTKTNMLGDNNFRLDTFTHRLYTTLHKFLSESDIINAFNQIINTLIYYIHTPN